MGLYEQIRDIAKSKGYSVNRLEQELGFARSSINKFNKNKPSVEKLQQIADFLNVSLDFLMTGQEAQKAENSPELTTRDERDIAKDLENIMNKLSAGESGPASYNGEDLDPEAADLFRDELEIALRRLKLINKEKYTNKRYKE